MSLRGEYFESLVQMLTGGRERFGDLSRRLTASRNRLAVGLLYNNLAGLLPSGYSHRPQGLLSLVAPTEIVFVKEVGRRAGFERLSVKGWREPATQKEFQVVTERNLEFPDMERIIAVGAIITKEMVEDVTAIPELAERVNGVVGIQASEGLEPPVYPPVLLLTDR